MSFDINTKAHIELTAKLGSLHRSALPVAVRGTLNSAAFETKKHIPEIASRKFITRNKSFFRAFSTVSRAGGFDINTMKAMVGIDSSKGSKVAEGLEKQETGGSIESRKLIAHDKARVSGSNSKRVQAKHRFKNINIADSRKKQKISTNYLLIRKGSKGTVFEIKSTGKKRKMIPIYSYRNTRISRVKSTPFMAPASMMAANKMAQFYLIEAEKQFKRVLR